VTKLLPIKINETVYKFRRYTKCSNTSSVEISKDSRRNEIIPIPHNKTTII